MSGNAWDCKKGICLSAVCVLSAILFRMLTPSNDIVASLFFFLRPLCYLTLYAFWGISIQRRVLHKASRHCLLAIVFLLLFWISVRTCRYLIPDTMQTALRFGWYFYYIPIVFIPTVSIFLALSIRKPETYCIPVKIQIVMLGVSVFLIASVLTNDLHQQVFRFPKGLEMGNVYYQYGPMYVFLAVWEGICALMALVVILRESRTERSQRYGWMPFAVLGIAFLYLLASLLRFPMWKFFCGDITSAYCLLYAALLESCILSGMIPANTRYEELFQAFTAMAQITDLDYEVRYCSGNGVEKQRQTVSRELMRQTEVEPVILPGGIRLSGVPVHGGHVLWQEDISELLKNLRELEEKGEELKDANLLEEENMKAEKRLERLKVKNQLYDMVWSQTQHPIRLLSGLVMRYPDAADAREQRKILGKIAVVGAYLKRRGNLIFLAVQKSEIPLMELTLCIEESMRSLTLYGVECACRTGEQTMIPGEAAMAVYDFFEHVIEHSLDTLEALQARIEVVEQNVIMRLCVECETDLYRALSKQEEEPGMQGHDRYRTEITKDFDGSWLITFCTGEERMHCERI